ncbi:MAG: DtxR family transcriptional regulator [Gemmatimonadetes bacterium]|nr:DtxR family transcriptional regulator [Gemmatimonadota bacterium]
MNPALSLLIFLASSVALVLIFWPRTGLIARLSRYRRLEERVLIEDTLKHLYNCEYAGRRATEESLAGFLETSVGHAVRTLARGEELGFLRFEGLEPVLTKEGQQYALRVLRAHRLLERYMADRTGVAPVEWHAEADRLEHTLSRDEAEGLASRLGHPLYDPHGDPIPTAAGGIPPMEGQPLATLDEGEIARIVHVEDEPPELFNEIVAAGLGPGMRLRLLDTSLDEVQFEAGGRVHRLSPAVASRITVVPAGEEVQLPTHSLADLEPGETGQVLRISPVLQGPQRRRLLDLGVVPGTEIQAEFASAAGDPVAYLIRGALIALRRDQAALIQLVSEPEADEALASHLEGAGA